MFLIALGALQLRSNCAIGPYYMIWEGAQSSTKHVSCHLAEISSLEGAQSMNYIKTSQRCRFLLGVHGTRVLRKRFYASCVPGRLRTLMDRFLGRRDGQCHQLLEQAVTTLRGIISNQGIHRPRGCIGVRTCPCL